MAAVYADRAAQGRDAETAWNEVFKTYAATHPGLAEEFTRRIEGKLPQNWKDKIPIISGEEPKALATRQHSEKVLNAVAEALPELVGGSADLTPSNLTALKVHYFFTAQQMICISVQVTSSTQLPPAVTSALECVNMLWRPYATAFLRMAAYVPSPRPFSISWDTLWEPLASLL